MEWGTVAEWAGAVGGFLAVVAALIAWRSSERLLALERKRDEQKREEVEREQAELVFAVSAKLEVNEYGEPWGIYLYNGSAQPIFDVCIVSTKAGGATSNHDLNLGVVPPGRFVIPLHKKYNWGPLIDLDRNLINLDLLVRGKGAETIKRLSFSDSRRRRWEIVNQAPAQLVAGQEVE